MLYPPLAAEPRSARRCGFPHASRFAVALTMFGALSYAVHAHAPCSASRPTTAPPTWKSPERVRRLDADGPPAAAVLMAGCNRSRRIRHLTDVALGRAADARTGRRWLDCPYSWEQEQRHGSARDGRSRGA